MELISRNTNTLAPNVYAKIIGRGHGFTSRNGPVQRLMEPVTICLERPWERVNFSPVRDANPFFHLIEAMAMLAPWNDAPFMAHFAKPMIGFSDDGHTFNAFYGTRARRWPKFEDPAQNIDQLDLVIKELIEKPDSRQCVVQLWDPSDLLKATKDKACNLCMLFDIVPGEECHAMPDGSVPSKVVRMTTFNRSNDAVLGGVTGANVVHLSFFHEYVARSVGLLMGSWWHVSNNLHAYSAQPQWTKLVQARETEDEDRYSIADLRTSPLFHDRATFDRELLFVICRMAATYGSLTSFDVIGEQKMPTEPFLLDTVIPVFDAWQAHKRADHADALRICERIEARDWYAACKLWLRRRYDSRKVQP